MPNAIRFHNSGGPDVLVSEAVTTFHEGKRDQYPFYLLLASSAVICAIAAATIIVIVLLIMPNFETIVVWSAVVFVVLIMTFIFLVAINETARQLDRFDDYKREFEQRWGSLNPLRRLALT